MTQRISPAGTPQADFPRKELDLSPDLQPSTLCSRAAIDRDGSQGAVVPPLHLSANYSFAGFGRKRTYDYTRSGNPTRDDLAATLAALEGGAGAVITATGMAAITLLLHQLRPGELCVLPHDGYGGTWRLATALARQGHFELLLVDQRDERALGAALARRPKLVWIESPSNPLLRVVDIAAVAAAAHDVGALVVCDNTFASPVLQQPLLLGADVVVHSTTKYINGHSDVVGGAVIAKHERLHQDLAWWANCLGITGAPFDAWLTLRGVRTLPLRMQQQQASAQLLAERLASHPAVRAVHYPGLRSHPDHELCRRQQRGPGAMLSFELADAAQVEALVAGLRLFTLAESLGGVESLIAHPATMTHSAMSEPARAAAGITAGLLRVSVGIEAPDDLWADLEAALDQLVQRGQAIPARRPAAVARVEV